MNEQWMEEIKHNDAMIFLEKYFPGQSFGDKTEQIAELCRIAEKSGFADSESIRKIVSVQIGEDAMSLHDETIASDGRRIIGKKYISDADASESGACKACLEYAGRIFKWPEEADKMPVLPRHPNCKCHYEDVYEENNITAEKIKVIAQMEAEYNSQLAESKRKIAEIAKQKYDLILQFENDSSANSWKNIYSISDAIDEYLLLAEEMTKVQDQLYQKLIHYATWINAKMNGCEEWIKNFVIIGLVGIEKCRTFTKEEHYKRLQITYQKLKYLPKSPEEAIRQGYTKAKDSENRYHGLHVGNEKYYHLKTGQEVVFDKNGNVVLDDKYLGTYNYGTYPVSIAHLVNDIWPYWKWGNTPNDTTPLDKRIVGTGREEK